MPEPLGDLRPYLVQVLNPLATEVLGTGFLCHPEGFVLTCWHVLASWRKVNRPEGTVRLGGQTATAKWIFDYSDEAADIAVLKLTKPEGQKLPYLPLDVHWRVHATDRFDSFGYPTGPFEKQGISIGPQLQGLTPTRVEGVTVLPLMGFNLDDIDSGYSGAPVFNTVTQKAIGLVHAKRHKTQAFLIPLAPLFARWPELRAHHDVFEHIRQRLGGKAQAKHAEKVRNAPFIRFALECGVIPERPEDQTQFVAGAREHGRTWNAFDLQRLLPPRRNYVLSSDVGTGKTTFVYWLAAELVCQTSAVPLLASCQELERLNPKSVAELVAGVTQHLGDEFLDIDLDACFARARVEGRLVYLFDALDQIEGDKPSVLAKLAFTLAGTCPVLVTSRPSAVLAIEHEPALTFLRLQPFSREDQSVYFGERYAQAEKVCALAPDLIAVPMLAYMLRELLAAGEADRAVTRTELYGKFLRHVVARHDPNLPLDRDEPDVSLMIQSELKRVAFLALADKEPKIQKVPFEAYPRDARVALGRLTAFGIVNRVLDRGEQALFFTHQSFQEFLAAQYAAGEPLALEQILAERWHEKWAEVIRFLAGMLGEPLLERLLARPDNVIHADIFLAAYCASELKRVSPASMGGIKEELWKLASVAPFRADAISALGGFGRWLDEGDVKQLTKCLRDDDQQIRWTAINALGYVGERLSADTMDEVVKLLRDDHWFVRRAAGAMITSLPPSRVVPAVLEVISWLRDEKQEVRDAAAGAFGQGGALSVLRQHVSAPMQRQIASLLDCPAACMRISAADALGKIGDRLDRAIHPYLLARLQDPDVKVRNAARRALCSAGERLDAESMRAVTAGLKDPNAEIRAETVAALGLLGVHADASVVGEFLKALEDPVRIVRWGATRLLPMRGEQRDASVVRCLVGRLDDPWDRVRYEAVEKLRALGDEAVAAAQGALVARMDDESPFVRRLLTRALGGLGGRLDPEVLHKIVVGLRHRSSRVRSCAASVLRHLGEPIAPDTFSDLVTLLGDEDADVRAAALCALSSFASRLDASLVRQIAARLDDMNEDVRFYAALTLGAIPDQLGPAEWHALVAHLRDRRFSARSTIVETLGRCGKRLDTKTIRALEACLPDKDEQVRKEAVRAIASIQTRLEPAKLADLLIARLQDDYRDVREAAAEALESVDGQVLSSKVPVIAKLLRSSDTMIRADTYVALWRLYRAGVPLGPTVKRPTAKRPTAKRPTAKRRARPALNTGGRRRNGR